MKRSVKHIFAGLLALCMLFTMVPMASAADSQQPSPATSTSSQANADSDIVRVSIMLEAPPALEQYADTGATGKEIASSEAAQTYQDMLLRTQKDVADAISAVIGKPLDVVWNLTLVSNAISANVQYGDIEAIRAIPGVSDVLIEPYITGIEESTVTSTSNAASLYASQIGTAEAYERGYYGAGMRIAILDTGINPSHQSFDGKALAYALKQDYGDDYATELNLLTVDEIRSKWSQLHVSSIAGFGADGADALYRSEKLPFNFNYPSHIANAAHDSSAHGSHVAGIAGANRYIFLNSDDTEPVLAADHVLVQGVAPDAQLLALRIVGSDGGAYASDQFAALEDALVLGADAVNMSIGTDWAGFSYSSEFQNVLDRLQQTDTVVAISAGNYGSLIDYGSNTDLLFIEDVSMNTISEPGSFTDAFTIASSDSACRVGAYFTANGNDSKLFYSESNKGASFSSLAKDSTYLYVYLDSLGVVKDPDNTNDDGSGIILENQMEALNAAVPGGLTGKVVLVNRGLSTFAEKADAAADLGAIAVVVVNNEPGSVSADLQNYQHENIPVVTLNLEDREALMQGAGGGTISAHYDSEGNLAESTLHYYTGTVKIAATYGAEESSDSNITMSSFSAWGVTGNLELKPEITAPGGDIFSVDGATTSGYTTMSGTSMATPQIAGLSALVMQYAKQNNLKETTGLTYRALAQSLLMSTAVPLKEKNGSYYPILQQGAGLANAGNAVTAPSYITVSGQPDGKVKVELKDDPDRKGSYSATFTIHNLTKEALDYTVSADLFTQAIETREGRNYLSTHTAPLQANVTINGGTAPARVTVPASGETTVTVTMALTASQKATLNSSYPNGAYIQAFLNVTPSAANGVSHSIPVLGFYGNWSDPSMFDSGYCPDGLSRTSTYGLSLEVQGSAGRHMINAPYDEKDPEQYLEERNSFDPTTSTLTGAYFLPLRNYSAGRCVIRDATAGTVYSEQDIDEGYGLFYIDTANAWGGYIDIAYLDWKGTDANGNPLPEGAKFSVEVTLAPEYYLNADGDINWDALGKGATISTTVTIDRTAPQLVEVEGSTLADGYITATVQDNRYVGMVALYRASAATDEEPLSYVLVDQTEAGKAIEVKLPIDQHDLQTIGSEGLILKVGDYAGHIASYPLSNLEGNRLALASPEIGLHGETFYAQVDDAMSADILSQLQEEGVEGVLISVEAPSGVTLPNIDVTIPCSLLQALDQQGTDTVRVLTPLANVIIPKAAFSVLKAGQGNVSVFIDQDAGNISVYLSVDGNPVTVPRGIQIQIPWGSCTTSTVAVQVKDDGSFKVIPTSVADSYMGRVNFTMTSNITVYILDTGTNFADVPENAWYADGVSFSSAHELVSGVGGNKFAPTANITRASIATLLYNLNGVPQASLTNPFSDVASGSWYETPVAWAVANNIISGNGTGGFSPDVDITREQLAVFLYNYAKFCGMDVTAEESLSGFADQGSVSSWARPALNWAVSNGLLNGVGGNKLLPGGTATRAEVAVLMMNYVQFLAGVSLGA